MSRPTLQARVVIAKKQELVEGPDDADVVVTVPLAEATSPGFDATVAYMQGRLKSTGSTGALFELLRDGSVAAAVSRLASQP